MDNKTAQSMDIQKVGENKKLMKQLDEDGKQ
jgi:hypothetical protein